MLEQESREVVPVVFDFNTGQVQWRSSEVPFDLLTLDDWAEIVNDINEQKGWNEPDRTVDRWAALAHTEISEYYEEFRNGHGPIEVHANDGKPGLSIKSELLLPTWPISIKPEGQAMEQADILVRTLHWFAYHGINPSHAMALKVRYNSTRPYRHGNKHA